MYTEREMEERIRKAERIIRKRRMTGRIKNLVSPAGTGSSKKDEPVFDILLTHAPCRGYGDMEDLPHRGFECFNVLLNKYSPQLHCYGHVHK